MPRGTPDKNRDAMAASGEEVFMYGKEEKERILAELHASGMTYRRAARTIPGFPCANTLAAWVRMEEAGVDVN